MRRNTEYYNLKEGVEIVKERIKNLIRKTRRTILINIAGGSASGKTNKVTAEIENEFKQRVVKISMDDYYKGKAFMEEETKRGNILNWDQPEALDMEKIRLHFLSLKKGISIKKPIYCMKTSEKIGEEEAYPKKLVILEGLFALQKGICEHTNLNIFIEVDTTTRLTRRILRDMERTGGKPEEIIRYFHMILEPMHKKYVESTKKRAHIIIRNPLNIFEELK